MARRYAVGSIGLEITHKVLYPPAGRWMKCNVKSRCRNDLVVDGPSVVELTLYNTRCVETMTIISLFNPDSAWQHENELHQDPCVYACTHAGLPANTNKQIDR